MKSKYYFHSRNESLSAKSVVYTVMVGQSSRERMLYAWFKSLCDELGFTLMPWSEDVDFYLELEAERVFPALPRPMDGWLRVTLSLTDVQFIWLSLGFEIYERNLYYSRTAIHQLKKLHSCFSFSANVRKILKRCPTLPRKT